jgi:hypothetical protein
MNNFGIFILAVGLFLIMISIADYINMLTEEKDTACKCKCENE